MRNFDSNKPLNSFDFRGEVAIVTGGAQGIGYAISRTLAELGADVIIADRDVNAVALASEKAGNRAQVFSCDVTDVKQVEELINTTWQRFGRIDMVVNNAGTAIRDSSVNLSLEDWQKVVDVNMTAVFSVARTAVRRHLGRDNKNTVLRIVNMASVMGLSGGGIYPNPSYQATKGAVVNMTRAMAVEWGPDQVRVNALAPTWVRTELMASLLADPKIVNQMEASMPLGRLAEPDDVAGAAMFLLSPAASMITGHTLAVDGGYLAQ
jgi:NAD(P)-dependent dehydrogenase (short-subunit alcohol dehydrogenase family)